MARILIMSDDDAQAVLDGWGDAVSSTVVEVVTVDDMEGTFQLECHGGGQCPTDVAPGQTWRHQDDALAEGRRHLLNHLAEQL